jgi:hypothetical protein
MAALPATGGNEDRRYFLDVLRRLAEPVLTALSRRKLKAEMPVEAPHGNAAERREFTHLEAFGRLLAGISPWLEDGATEGGEGELRRRCAELARESMAAAVDPVSPDFLNFNRGSQPVVDAAFLALAILRAPGELFDKLDKRTRQQLIAALRSSRVIQPSFSNWLLFSATVEALLAHAGEAWDRMRVDYAVRQIDEWYKGDGLYADGPQFHCDYYNSFVIHPMLLAIVETTMRFSNAWQPFYPAILERANRYAAIQERLIGPEGEFPPLGRSLAYRFGAFHLLADMALRRQLPEAITPEQVRGALAAVMRRMAEAPGTFDAKGWLRVGFCGHQPTIAEPYISTGSLYLCSTALLPLGLPASDAFWSKPARPWSSQLAWSGRAIAADHALSARIG